MNKCKICNGPTRAAHHRFCDPCVNGIAGVNTGGDNEEFTLDEMAWAAKRGREVGRAEMRERMAQAIEEYDVCPGWVQRDIRALPTGDAP